MLKEYEDRPISSNMLRVHLDFFSALADFGVLDFQSLLRVFEIFSTLFKEILDKLLQTSSLSLLDQVDDFSFFDKIEFLNADFRSLRMGATGKARTFRSKAETFAYQFEGELARPKFIRDDEEFKIYKEALKLLLRICEFSNFLTKIISKMIFILSLYFFKEIYIEDPRLEM